jgi:hypothetical protein
VSPPRVGPINGNEPVIVRGAPFTFRTLHAENGWTWSRMPLSFSLDRIMTVTLGAVAGLHHHETATMEVTL